MVTAKLASEQIGERPEAGLQTKPESQPLIFEYSAPGKTGVDLEPAEGGGPRGSEILGPGLCRDDLPGFPELSEPEVMRHFLRLSQLNFSPALQFYPLGSCTMKYNPPLNDEMADLAGFAALHPLVPAAMAQGALELMKRLEAKLAAITGMDAVSLHPAAGAHGELTGLLIARAHFRKRGERRTKVLVPDTAHGTNPASCRLAGFEVVAAPSNRRGFLEADTIRRLLDPEVAALMVTNPNTLGVFEAEILEIAEALHRNGSLLYMDGANMNALFGVAKPGHMGIDILQLNLHKSFSTPHGGGGPGAGPVAVTRELELFLPVPRLKRGNGGWEMDYDRPDSIGRLRAFHGNFAMLVRAYAYILALGAEGLTKASRLAILAANYLRVQLAPLFPPATEEPVLHECVFTHDLEHRFGVTTLDIAKRLLDFNIHPPTVYFPLVVPGALMIEPTETESRATLDDFVAAMERIYAEAENEPELVKQAPHALRLRRIDEAQAARRPILRWTSNGRG